MSSKICVYSNQQWCVEQTHLGRMACQHRCESGRGKGARAVGDEGVFGNVFFSQRWRRWQALSRALSLAFQLWQAELPEAKCEATGSTKPREAGRGHWGLRSAGSKLDSHPKVEGSGPRWVYCRHEITWMIIDPWNLGCSWMLYFQRNLDLAGRNSQL